MGKGQFIPCRNVSTTATTIATTNIHGNSPEKRRPNGEPLYEGRYGWLGSKRDIRAR